MKQAIPAILVAALVTITWLRSTRPQSDMAIGGFEESAADAKDQPQQRNGQNSESKSSADDPRTFVQHISDLLIELDIQSSGY